ncbi:MAG TPA: addiction module killer protein [Bacteroidales bacterium]|nr:addiction module killer protein [Bacteroidales bacterium]
MTIEFEKEFLYELYTLGKTKGKVHRYQPQIIRKYIDVINIFRSINKKEELFNFKSLHYEKKVGSLQGIEAVWVNRQFRLEFITYTRNTDNQIIIVCRILNLSNHYKK